jgi:hypothetical protein
MIERKSGTILRFNDDNSGFVSDDSNPGSEHQFEHAGARPVFDEGESVIYLLIKAGTTVKAVNLGRPN